MKLLDYFKKREKPLSPEGLLTAPEYARYKGNGWSYAKVQRLRREGVIDGVKIKGVWYYDQVDCDTKLETRLSDTGKFRLLQPRFIRYKKWMKKYRYAIIVTLLLVFTVSFGSIKLVRQNVELQEERHQRVAAESEAAYYLNAFLKSAKTLNRRIGLVDVAQELGENIDETIAREWEAAISLFLEENPNAELPEFSFADQTDYIARLLSEKLEEDRQAAAYAEREAEYIPNLWPLEKQRRITSGYGQRYVSSGSLLSRIKGYFVGWELHKGVDIPAPMGTPVLATASGEVIFSGWRKSYGRVVIIQHGDTYKTVYAHLSRSDVAEGQTVERENVIGLVGSTGTSTGNHLHYEIYVFGSAVNPRRYLP